MEDWDCRSHGRSIVCLCYLYSLMSNANVSSVLAVLSKIGRRYNVQYCRPELSDSQPLTFMKVRSLPRSLTCTGLCTFGFCNYSSHIRQCEFGAVPRHRKLNVANRLNKHELGTCSSIVGSSYDIHRSIAGIFISFSCKVQLPCHFVATIVLDLASSAF